MFEFESKMISRLNGVDIELSEYEKAVIANNINKTEEEVLELVEAAEQAENRASFIKKVLEIANPETQAYGVFSKQHISNGGNIERLLSESKRYSTSSDAGSIRIGNDDFQTMISNGYGDGDNKVYIVRKGEKFNDYMMNYQTVVQGKFKISRNDAHNWWIEDLELDGRFHVYSYERIVALVEF